MRAYSLDPRRATAEEIAGLVAAHDVPRPKGERGFAFRKGQHLAASDLPLVARLPGLMHVVRPDAGDISEDEAGRRLANAVAGAGLTMTGPAQSRYNLVAEHRGVVRVDSAVLDAINAIDGMAVFTLYDRQPVEAGMVVAGAKVAPLVIDEVCILDASRLAATSAAGVIRVAPFIPTRIATLYREKLAATARQRFEDAVRTKAEWFGSTATEIVPVSDDPDAIAATLSRFIQVGAGLIFAAGGSSTDPIDATIVALERLGARLIRRGVPVHPGSMFWLADLDGVPVVSLASCSLFSQATIVDVVLPRLLSGEAVAATDLAALGHGGLMERGMDWRFPPYTRPERSSARSRPSDGVAE